MKLEWSTSLLLFQKCLCRNITPLHSETDPAPLPVFVLRLIRAGNKWAVCKTESAEKWIEATCSHTKNNERSSLRYCGDHVPPTHDLSVLTTPPPQLASGVDPSVLPIPPPAGGWLRVLTTHPSHQGADLCVADLQPPPSRTFRWACRRFQGDTWVYSLWGSGWTILCRSSRTSSIPEECMGVGFAPSEAFLCYLPVEPRTKGFRIYRSCTHDFRVFSVRVHKPTRNWKQNNKENRIIFCVLSAQLLPDFEGMEFPRALKFEELKATTLKQKQKPVWSSFLQNQKKRSFFPAPLACAKCFCAQCWSTERENQRNIADAGSSKRTATCKDLICCSFSSPPQLQCIG